MSELKKTFDYEFAGDLSYVKDGEQKKAVMLSIKAPTNRNIDDVLVLEQELAKSQMNILSTLKESLGEGGIEKLSKMRDDVDDSEESQNTRESILQQLMGGGADVKKCMNALKKILLSNPNGSTAFVDESTKLTETIYNDFSFIDTKNILGE